MWSKFFKVMVVALFLANAAVPVSFAESEAEAAGTPEEEIVSLKQQVKQMMDRIDKLEAAQAKAKEESAKAKEEVAKLKEAKPGEAPAPKVDLANSLSKLKIKGRAVAGYFDSGKAGAYLGSFEVPDAKVQFGFQPDQINTIVLRMNLNNAAFNNVDYFYLESKDFLPLLADTPFSLNGRLGKFKLGFGEETWSDNRVEGILPSNSAASTGVTDEGAELNGKIKLDGIGLKPLGWVASISNGNSGTATDTSTGKAFMGKLYYTPVDPLYLSASYYDSGRMETANSDFTIGGLATRPAINGTNASNWERRVWEANARYDFGKGKKSLNPPAYSNSKAHIRLSYGQFDDDAVAADAIASRYGDYGFVDGMYNFNKKFYAAGRYSIIDMRGDTTATLNSITANEYHRYSLGGGWRWSDNTILKLSYDWNKNKGSGTEEADDDLLSAMVGTQF